MRKETRQKGGRTYYLRSYRDWLDFLSFAERIQSEGDRQTCASLTEGDVEWYGTHSLKETIEMARCGWPDGRKKVQLFRDRLRVEQLFPTSHRITPTLDIDGDEVDIDRYLNREPEHMVTLNDTAQPHRGKIIRFVLSRDGRCSVESDTMVRRGVALLTAVETLRLLGFSTEIIIMFAVHAENEHDYFEQVIPVLHAGDPVNLDTLAFLFLHPSVLRRLCFAAAECESKDIRSKFGFHRQGGYGYPCRPDFLPQCDFFCNWDEGLIKDDDEIIPFTKNILRNLGVEPTSAQQHK